MAQHIVEFLRDGAGSDDMESWTRSLDADEIVDLMNEYSVYAARWHHPLPSDDGLRPYVPIASPILRNPYAGIGYEDEFLGLRPTVLGQVAFGIAGFDPRALAANAEGLVRRLKQHLLYCSAVAIDNPLGPVGESWFGGHGPRVAAGALQAETLGDYTALIGKLARLIEVGALVLVEHPDGPRTAERALLEEMDELTRPSPGRLYLGDVGIEAIEHNLATIDYARARSLANRTGAYHCYAPPGPMQSALAAVDRLSWQIVSEQTGMSVPELPDDRESKRLELLLKLELPRLDDLPLEDIAAVRDTDEFAAMRVALARALDDALACGVKDPELLRAMIDEALAEPRERLARAIRRSRTLRDTAADSREQVLVAASVIGIGVGLGGELLGDATFLEAIARLSAQEVAAGALTAGWTASRIWRELSKQGKLPTPKTVRDHARTAAHKQLCVFGTA